MTSVQGPNGGAMRLATMGLVVAIVLAPARVSAAPTQLYGKSVTVNWAEIRSQRIVGLEAGFHPVSRPWTLTVYIGTEGHIFRRMITRANRQSGVSDRAGLSGSGAHGSFSVQFQGNSMIATGSSSGGFAHRVQVTFDSGFGNCTAQAITGLQAGSRTVMLRSMIDGATIEIESASAGAASCSVAQGNPFAH